MTQRAIDGTIRQSGLSQNPADYNDERIYYPVVGIVMAVHFSDDPTNALTIPLSNQRGSGVTCDVLVINHGNDNPWFLPNVVVLPSGPSGVDDYCEEIPRPSSLMIDGSAFNSGLNSIDYEKLDGDWCVVEFIGGSSGQPVMMKWWPHPGNRQDPATAGFKLDPPPASGSADPKTLQQGRRSFKRYAGAKVTVTSEGSFYVDTNESNAEIIGSKSGVARKKRDKGGDIQVDVKPARKLQVNFNEPVPLPKTEPSLPQPNPPQGEKSRKTDRTTVTLDKDTINLLAGKICEILTSDDYIDFHAKTKVRLRGDDGNDSIILGDTDPIACDHAVKGETFQALMNAFILWATTHTHSETGTTTGTPIQPFAQTMTATHLSQPVMVKK